MTDEKPHYTPRRRLVDPLPPYEPGSVSSEEHRRLVRDREDPLPEHFEPEPPPPQEPPPDDDDDRERTFLDYQLDWHLLFADAIDRPDEWLCEPILAVGRGHALYAPAKAGKSFFALALAAGIATGTKILARPEGNPVDVIYCDYEMTADDVLTRLETFGHDDPDKLARLHYVQLPDVGALDTRYGGEVLAADAERVGAKLVVIDTTGRAVNGKENDADTYLSFFNHTGRRLKRLGCAWLRIDHAGKDLRLGQRGTSAKNDDVDVVWELIGADEAFDLKATHRRVDWIPRDVHIDKTEDNFVISLMVAENARPAGTIALAGILDRLELPLDISVRKARSALKATGETARNETLVAALKWRRECYQLPLEEPG